jgi:hypothetical protein
MGSFLQGLKTMNILRIFTRTFPTVKRPGRADPARWQMLSKLLEAQAMMHGTEGSELADPSSELELKALQLMMKNLGHEGPKEEGQSR